MMCLDVSEVTITARFAAFMKGFQGLGMDLWCQRWYWHWCEPVDCDMDVGCAV